MNVAPALASADPALASADAAAARTKFLAEHMVDTSKWTPHYIDKPPGKAKFSAHEFLHNLAAGAGTTVPYWTTTITSPLDGNTYTYSMVGSSPYAAHPSNTNVTYVPVAIRIHLNGFTLDPTAPSNCDAESPARRFFNSPIFRPTSFTSNGVNVSAVPGGTQLISAFQRANFWNAVKRAMA